MNNELDCIAAHWLARRFAGLTAHEEQELRRWLAADERHARAFRELEATWTLLDGVREAVRSGAIPDPDALAPRRRRTNWFFPVAAAAALVLGYLGWPHARPAQPYATEVTTTAGSFQRLALPDGSVMRLNADTQVRVRFGAGDRRVELLRGEAHFTVAKDSARPFLVEAGRVAVRAVGTAFNVRLAGGSIEVLVTEGRVRVDDTARGESVLAPRDKTETPLLVSGERAVISVPPIEPIAERAALAPLAAVVPLPVSPDEIQTALAWHERRLEFEAAALSEIVAEFNRCNRAQLRIDDPALAARRFGGSFRADDPENFVRLLQARFGVRVEVRGDETILRGPR